MRRLSGTASGPARRLRHRIEARAMTPPIEVRDMRIVHLAFRKAYDEAARLLRAGPMPSPDRVEFLADHVDFAIPLLHGHHESEDELLYPKLLERVPELFASTEEVAKEHLE